jgi:hypothetical protein
VTDNDRRPPYDSRPDTFLHSLRDGALMDRVITELSRRSVEHDLSKTVPPEVATFDEFTPLLKDTVYDSEQYRAQLAAMAPALAHHYANNPHHPEAHQNGIKGMTLVDLIEMLADWKATTERVSHGDLRRSIRVNADRFGYGDELAQILLGTAEHFGWVPAETAPAALDSRAVLESLVRMAGPEGIGWTAMHKALHSGGDWGPSVPVSTVSMGNLLKKPGSDDPVDWLAPREKTKPYVHISHCRWVPAETPPAAPDREGE